MSRQLVSVERVRELLHYEPATGVFTWKVRANRKHANVGDVAGSMDRGYRAIKIDEQTYKAHRLAWLYVHGSWPAGHLDHINRVRDDNRLCNLREATQAQNNQNKSRSRNNKSGFTGVSISRGKWRALLGIGGRQIHLGRFDTPEEAHEAYKAAASRIHTHSSVNSGAEL